MHRLLRRSLVVASVLAVTTTIITGTAAASDETIAPGAGISYWLAAAIFVGVPAAVFLIIAALVYGPDLGRRPRYRPGVREWSHRPVWIGGPATPDAALSATPPDRVIDVRGGGCGAGW